MVTLPGSREAFVETGLAHTLNQRLYLQKAEMAQASAMLAAH
jgi:hypothetical protein